MCVCACFGAGAFSLSSSAAFCVYVSLSVHPCVCLCLCRVYSQLLYPYRRTGDSVRTQIRTVMDLLMDAQFLPVLESKILRIVKEDQFSIGSEGNWQEQVASNLRELCMAGSYHQALSHKLMTIILKAMAIVMSFVDRNYNLAVFKEGSGLSNRANMVPRLCDCFLSSILWHVALRVFEMLDTLLENLSASWFMDCMAKWHPVSLGYACF